MKDSLSSSSAAGMAAGTGTGGSGGSATPTTPTTPTAAGGGSSGGVAGAGAAAGVAPAIAADPQQAPQQQQQQQRGKSNIHELRNQDFVSRLMAATPPYLYSAPVGPNNFFFSDMLRSLVQARNNETARVLQLQQQQAQQQQQQQHQQQQQQQQHHQASLVRRPRKRSWSHRPYYEQLRERREAEEKQQQQQQQQQQQPQQLQQPEKPLELTNKVLATAASAATPTPYGGYAKLETKPAALPPPTKSTASGLGLGGLGGAVDSALQDNTPPAASLPPQDLVLPPPPPVWYPPLYAPYGIDPLHFFIDLRVSGHIYDRKKENVSPLSSTNNNNNALGEEGSSSCSSSTTTTAGATASANSLSGNLLSKQRHGSAFTVPIPKAAQSDAINLCANPSGGAGGGGAGAGHGAGATSPTSVSVLGSKFEHYAKYYDLGETKENQPASSTTAANHLSAAAAAAAAAANLSKSSASYMLQHLPRLYSQFAAHHQAAQVQQHQQDTESAKSESVSASVSASLSVPDLCDDDSMMGRGSSDTAVGPCGGGGEADCEGSGGGQGNCDIDVEIIDSIKYRTDGESSRYSSNDEASITQID